MRAAMLETSPGHLIIDDVSIDGPRRHEVLIRTAAAGLCHSDLHFMEGSWPCPLPAVLGHESAGVVEAVGEDVTYVQPGDHVITCLSTFCGQCSECLTGRLYICSNPAAVVRGAHEPPRLSRDGTPVFPLLKLASFAEQMLVHQHSIVKIDRDMPLDRAALIGCAVTTGVGAVFRTAQVEPGSTVVVLGCGGVGLNVVQGARLAGAGRIIAIDLLESKREMAQQFGATDVAGSAEDIIAEVLEVTKGGADYVFEAVGSKRTIEMAFPMTKPGGSCTLIGMSPLGTKVEFDATAFLYDRKVQGSMIGSNRFRVDMPRYVDLYQQGRLMLDELVSARIGLDQINEGFDALKQGSAARSVIVF